MKFANRAECLEAGINHMAVERLAARLDKLAREAESPGISIFGGSHSGYLRFHDCDRKGELILASINRGRWSGGDGGSQDFGDGLLRGEL